MLDDRDIHWRYARLITHAGSPGPDWPLPRMAHHKRDPVCPPSHADRRVFRRPPKGRLREAGVTEGTRHILRPPVSSQFFDSRFWSCVHR